VAVVGAESVLVGLLGPGVLLELGLEVEVVAM